MNRKVAYLILAGATIVSGIAYLQTNNKARAANCDAAYPDVCIPSPPPDLNCKDIKYRNFKVLQPDPHGFDRDFDGIGCEK